MAGVIRFVGMVDFPGGSAQVMNLATYENFGLVSGPNEFGSDLNALSFATVNPTIETTAPGGGHQRSLTDRRRGLIYANGSAMVLNVYDATALPSVVRLGGITVTPNPQGDILYGGPALVNGGNTLVAAVDRSSDSSDNSFAVFDVTSTTPVFRYQSPRSSRYGQFSMLGWSMDGSYNEPFAYLASYAYDRSPLLAIDVTNPAAPVEGTHQIIPSVAGLAGVRCVHINRQNPDYMYMTHEDGTFKVYDISTRMNPVLLRTIGNPDGSIHVNMGQFGSWPVADKFVQKGSLLMGCAGSTVQTVDVSDPGWPVMYATRATMSEEKFRGAGSAHAMTDLLPDNRFAIPGQHVIDAWNGIGPGAVAVYEHFFVEPGASRVGGWSVGVVGRR